MTGPPPTTERTTWKERPDDLAAIWAVRAGRRWVRGAATAPFVLGTGTALFDPLITDTSGDTGLAPLLGWTGMPPCAAGLLAVALLWRKA